MSDHPGPVADTMDTMTDTPTPIEEAPAPQPGVNINNEVYIKTLQNKLAQERTRADALEAAVYTLQGQLKASTDALHALEALTGEDAAEEE